MTVYEKIKPDEDGLAIALASKALKAARSMSTANPGSIFIPNGDGTGTLIGQAGGTDSTGGSNGMVPWVGDTTPPGKPTGCSASSAWGTIYCKWDGTLEGGVPSDFAHVSVSIAGTEMGRMQKAGSLAFDGYSDGQVVEVSFTAYDDAHDQFGNPAPNASGATVVSVTVSDERAEIDAEVEKIKGDMEQAAQDAADAKEAAAEASSKADAAADKADSYQSQIDDVTATVNGVEQEVAGFSSQIQGAVEDATQALTAATEASQGLEGFKTTVSQTYETKADADAAMAQEVLDRNSAIEQSAGEILSTVSQNYVDNETGETLATKAEVSQTASEIKQEVSEEYQVKGDYLTEDEAASSYASKSELTQTADSIKAEVSQDYQTKAGMSAYATNSSVEQTAAEIESNVAATYQTKAGMSAYATNSSVTQTANSIKQEVAVTYATQDEVDSISVGGTNLLLGTAYKNLSHVTVRGGYGTVSIDTSDTVGSRTSLKLVTTQAGASGIKDVMHDLVPKLENKKVVVSFWVKGSVAASMMVRIGGGYTAGSTAMDKAVTTSWSRVVLEMGPLSGNGSSEAYVIIAFNKAGTFRVSGMKCEYGNRPTDWSPAPEDMLSTSDAQATYATKTSLQQTEDSILSSVESEYQSKDGMSSYATKSYVDQQDGSIKSTVSSVQKTADSALTKATTVEQTADGLEVRLTQAEKDVDTAQSTANTAKTNASNAQSTANTANTTANAAKTAATTAQTTATNAAKTATNYLKFDSSGLCVGNQSGTLQGNTLITSNGVKIRNGTTELASFTASSVKLGGSSTSIQFGSYAHVSSVGSVATFGYGSGDDSSGSFLRLGANEVVLQWPNAGAGGTKTTGLKLHTNSNQSFSGGKLYHQDRYLDGTSGTTYQYFCGRQLYSNSSGATGAITLSESAANFTFLDIFIINNEKGCDSVRVWSPNGKIVDLTVTTYKNEYSKNYIRQKEISISGTKISLVSNHSGESQVHNGNVCSGEASTGVCRIYAVWGWW